MLKRGPHDCRRSAPFFVRVHDNDFLRIFDHGFKLLEGGQRRDFEALALRHVFNVVGRARRGEESATDSLRVAVKKSPAEASKTQQATV